MSLLNRLLPRAGHGSVALARPKGIVRMDAPEEVQPLLRAEDEEAQPLSRQDAKDVATPLRRQEPDQADLSRDATDEEAGPIHRMDEKEAQPLHRLDQPQALPVHREEGEDEVQPIHRTDTEEDQAQPLHRNASPPDTQHATLKPQALHRAETGDELESETDAMPLHRLQEDHQPLTQPRAQASALNRTSPAEDQPLPEQGKSGPDTIPEMKESQPAMALHREMAATPTAPPQAPVMTEAAPAPLADPTSPVFEQGFTEPDADPVTFEAAPQPAALAPQGPAKVVIDQVDVVIQEPARSSTSASPMADLSAMARRRYLGGY